MIALKGAEYLQRLIESDAIISEPSNALDSFYSLEKPVHLTREDLPLGAPEEEILLSKAQFDEIGKHFKDNEIAVLGKRAITQISKQLQGDLLKKKAR